MEHAVVPVIVIVFPKHFCCQFLNFGEHQLISVSLLIVNNKKIPKNSWNVLHSGRFLL